MEPNFVNKDQLNILYNSIFFIFCGLAWLTSVYILWKRRLLSPERILRQPSPSTQISFLPVLGVFGIYFCWLIVLSLINEGIGYLFPKWVDICHGMVVGNIVLDSLAKLATLPFLLTFVQILVKGGISEFGLGKKHFLQALPQGVKALGLFLPWWISVAMITSFISTLVRHGEAPKHPILKEMGQNQILWEQMVLLVSAVVMAPLVEELFFRGLIHAALHRLISWNEWREGGNDVGVSKTKSFEVWSVQRYFSNKLWNRWSIILISSVFFAVVHGTNGWEAVVIIFPLALGLGLVYELTGNLWACMVLHGLFNGLNLLLNSVDIK